jgi:hypothetical protein
MTAAGNVIIVPATGEHNYVLAEVSVTEKSHTRLEKLIVT